MILIIVNERGKWPGGTSHHSAEALRPLVHPVSAKCAANGAACMDDGTVCAVAATPVAHDAYAADFFPL